jgi:hypothetical protein
VDRTGTDLLLPRQVVEDGPADLLRDVRGGVALLALQDRGQVHGRADVKARALVPEEEGGELACATGCVFVPEDDVEDRPPEPAGFSGPAQALGEEEDRTVELPLRSNQALDVGLAISRRRIGQGLWPAEEQERRLAAMDRLDELLRRRWPLRRVMFVHPERLREAEPPEEMEDEQRIDHPARSEDVNDDPFGVRPAKPLGDLGIDPDPREEGTEQPPEQPAVVAIALGERARANDGVRPPLPGGAHGVLPVYQIAR